MKNTKKEQHVLLPFLALFCLSLALLACALARLWDLLSGCESIINGYPRVHELFHNFSVGVLDIFDENLLMLLGGRVDFSRRLC